MYRCRSCDREVFPSTVMINSTGRVGSLRSWHSTHQWRVNKETAAYLVMTCGAQVLETIIWLIMSHDMLYKSIHSRNNSIVSIKTKGDLCAKIWLIYDLRKGAISYKGVRPFVHSHGANQLTTAQMTGYWSLMRHALENEGVQANVLRSLQLGWWEWVRYSLNEGEQRLLRCRLDLEVCVHMTSHLWEKLASLECIQTWSTVPKISTT